MEVICIDEPAFYKLVDQVVAHVKLTNGVQQIKWIAEEEAMHLLNIKSKTTLQKLRDENKIRFSQPQTKIILYDRDSINAYIEKHVSKTYSA